MFSIFGSINFVFSFLLLHSSLLAAYTRLFSGSIAHRSKRSNFSSCLSAYCRRASCFTFFSTAASSDFFHFLSGGVDIPGKYVVWESRQFGYSYLGLSHSKREPFGSLLPSALRVVHLHPTSFRNSLYTLILNNILFILPKISSGSNLFSSFLTCAATHNVNSFNPCLSFCFTI